LNAAKKAVLKGSKMKIPKNIHIMQHLAKSLEQSIIDPSSNAVIFGERADDYITYRELDFLSNAVGNAFLKKLGPQPVNKNPEKELVVALCLPPSLQFISLILATLKIGAAYCPIMMDFPEERIVGCIKHVQPIIVVISNKDRQIYQKFDNIRNDNLCNHIIFIVLEDLWESINNVSVPMDPVPCIQTTYNPDITYPPYHKRIVAVFNGSSRLGGFRSIRYKSPAILNMIIWEWKTFKMSQDEKCLIQAELDTVLSIGLASKTPMM
jgi:acyl-CoA synthetase (AMP-forming)/AMP-acid ligase II